VKSSKDDLGITVNWANKTSTKILLGKQNFNQIFG
jgi:hypothetical protein